MTMTDQETLKNRQELDQIIDRAITKINGSKENDICKFLPVEAGGYMHHFTLRKMKSEQPSRLGQMISQYILKTDKPARVRHKPRRPRGSRKKHDVIALSRTELERLLLHISKAGDDEMMTKFSRRQSLALLKKQLIASIRKNIVDSELWNAFVELASLQHPFAEGSQPTLGHVMVTAHPA